MQSTSVVTVNRTDTEITTFCYLRTLSSPHCFRPKTVPFLCFNFSYYILNSLRFYILHRCSAISLHLTVDLRFAHHHCLYTCYCLEASTHPGLTR